MKSREAVANIETVYPLTPIQEGMLFHCLEDQSGGVYVEQYKCRITGKLDVGAFRRSWDDTVARHPALRSFFVWEKVERPVQIVRRNVSISWENLDWTNSAPAEQEARFVALAQDDHQRGFALDKAPLMRFTLISVANAAHRFLWTHHHLLTDGWSTALVLREVFGRYRELSSGSTYSTPPPPAPESYIDWVMTRDMARAERHWRKKLKGFREINALLPPLEPAGSDAQDRESHGQQWLPLGTQATEALNQFARRLGLTPSALFFGAWGLLVGKYSQRREAVFGMTTAGRSSGPPGIESVVGVLFNTIPMRVTLSPDDRVGDWLKKVQGELYEAMAFEQTPLPQIQSWSELPSRQALFQSLAVYANYPGSGTDPSASDSIRLEQIEYHEYSNYPVSAIAVPGPELRLLIIHDRRLLSDAAARRMVGQLGMLLSSMPQRAENRVRDLDLLTADERLQLLSMGESPLKLAPECPDVLERILSAAEKASNRTAVVCGPERIDYRTLIARSKGLADRLRAQGVRPGEYVAVALDRGVNLPVAIVGITMAGAAYVPLDPSYPRQRILASLAILRGAQDANRVWLVTARGTASADLAAPNQTISMDEVAESTAPLERIDSVADMPAYLIFTSGSTGLPKGVVVTRRNLGASTAARCLFYSQNPPTSFLLASSFAFDSAAAGLFWTLCSGGKLVLPSPAPAMDLELLSKAIEAEQVTHTLMLPSLHRLLLEQVKPHHSRSLELVIVAGEVCPPDLPRLHTKELPQTELYNEYGPTEATIWCTAEHVTGNSGRASTAIGRPIPGTRLYILDQDQYLMPIGIPGEIVVAGPGVAAGYLGAKEQTRARFLPDPFVSGGRMYRTGDRGYLTADGEVQFLGRLDEQIKVRGFRVEPTEIETHLRDYQDVADAAVVVTGNSGLAAFIVPRKSAGLNFETLHSWLAERLPHFMLPGVWQSVDALPTTPAGKVDRLRLSRMAVEMTPMRLSSEATRSEHKAAGWAPEEALTVAISNMFERMLGITGVRASDDFFEIGGASLSAMRLLADLNNTFSARLSISTVFEYRSPLQLAAALLQNNSMPTTGHLVPIQHHGDKRPVFCVHGDAYFLSKHLALDRPFYWLTPWPERLQLSRRPWRLKPVLIPGIAEKYTREIRTVQPHGPYQLSGSCDGAVIAMEMARQLRQAGEEVSLLALFDHPATAYQAKPRATERIAGLKSLPEKIKTQRTKIDSKHRGVIFDYAMRFAGNRLRRALRLDSLLIQYHILTGREMSLRLARAYTNQILGRAADAYQLESYDGKTVLFLSKRWAGEAPEGYSNAAADRWRRLFPGELDVYPLAAPRHNDLFREPHVEELARKLTRHLN